MSLTKAQKEELRYRPKTSIGQVIESNKRLYKETSQVMKCTPAKVEEIMEFVGIFVANTMREGVFQTIMLPYFGKFKPKKKYLKFLQEKPKERENSMDLMQRAIRGKKLLRKDPMLTTIQPIKPPEDETV